MPKPRTVDRRSVRRVPPRVSHRGDVSTRIFTVATAPVIYSLVVPFAVLHAWVWLYERICFPIYGAPFVRWTAYLAADRHQLPYLNAIERLNCAYCGYANGLLAYVREVAARTEAYWCPIKHQRAVRDPHRLYRSFARYGDQHGYKRYLREHPLARVDTGYQATATRAPRRRGGSWA